MANTITPNALQQQKEHMVQQIREECRGMIEELKQHKMSTIVEDIITKYLTKLSKIGPEVVSPPIRNAASSTRTSHHMQNEPKTPHQRTPAQDISEEYKLLSKSIEKLKNM